MSTRPNTKGGIENSFLVTGYQNSPSLTLIVKVPGARCNIDCQYCFEKRKGLCDTGVVHSQQIADFLDKSNIPVEIVLHGGEPLVAGVSAFRDILTLCTERTDKVKAVSLQTNGTLLDKEWIELLFSEFAPLSIDIAISIDGLDEMNYDRHDYDGGKVLDRSLNAFHLLEKAGKKSGILSVVGRRHLDHATSYMSLLKTLPNISFVKINPLFNLDKYLPEDSSITPMEYAQFITEVAVEYINSGEFRRYPIEPILSALQRVNNQRSRFCNFDKRKCLRFISLYPDGFMSLCDTLQGKKFPVFIKDSVSDAIKQTMKNESFGTLVELASECERCDTFQFCQGGCMAQRYAFRNNPDLAKEYCNSRRYLLDFFQRFRIQIIG